MKFKYVYALVTDSTPLANAYRRVTPQYDGHT
jgi:hypothetical protein